MQFSLDPEEEMIRDTARRIGAERLAPLAERLDRGEGGAEFLANLASRQPVFGKALPQRHLVSGAPGLGRALQGMPATHAALAQGLDIVAVQQPLFLQRPYRVFVSLARSIRLVLSHKQAACLPLPQV